MKARGLIFGFLLGFAFIVASGCQRNIVRAEPPSVASPPTARTPLPQPTAATPPADSEPVPVPEPAASAQPPPIDIAPQPGPARPRPAPAEAEAPKPRPDAPAPEIAPQLSARQQADATRRTTDAVRVAEKNLQSSVGKRLNVSQKDLVEKIQDFLSQAHEAIRANDWVRAENLAQKAQVLSAELLKVALTRSARPNGFARVAEPVQPPAGATNAAKIRLVRSYDAIVIGGGIIGGAIALRLAQEKLRVALFDRQEPGREASWAAAGMLSPAPDSPSAISLVPFGRASLSLYPSFVAEVEEISGRRAGLRHDGAIELLFSADAERELSTLVALHHGLGLPTEPLPLDEARKLEPALGREARAAALLPYEGSVNTRALIEALLAAATASGVELHAHGKVTRVLSGGGRCTGIATENKRFSAGNVVLAAGAFSQKIEGLEPPVAAHPIRGQMVALRNSATQLRHVLRSERGYIVPRDAATPQYLVTGSTLEDAGFEKRVTPRGLEQILSAAQELAPNLAGAEIVDTWCGLRPDTPDHLPLLGPGELSGLTIATGHYRNGILLAPITARLVREWIIEQRTSMDWDVFDPLRFKRSEPAEEPRAASPSRKQAHEDAGV